MKKRLSSLIWSLFVASQVFAQAPSGLYLKTMNSYLAGSPEATQMMKHVDYPVNLFTGTPSVSIPIYTLTGDGISVPVSLSYHAGGGVKVDELSTNIGLGFSLQAGGEITRETRGGPDEGLTGAGFLSKPNPISYYIDKYNCCIGTPAGDPDKQMWVQAMNGQLDLEPDIFYFSFGGRSGKFVYDDSIAKFVCLNENEHLNITFDHATAATSFTIVASDGNKYIFAARQTNSSRATNLGPSGNMSPQGPATTVSWKLSKIINADATDSIMLNYVGEYYSYFTDGANIEYQTIQGSDRNPVLSYSDNIIDGQSKLSSITGKSGTVTFVDGTSNRVDLVAGNKPLSKIIIKDKDNVVRNIFALHQSYFFRLSEVGTLPVTGVGSVLLKSLRLDSISEYGNSETNANPLRHTFTYNSTSLPARLSFEKDWWGYPSYNDYEPSLVPPTIMNDGQEHPGADRHPDPSRIYAGILTTVKLPTGGTVTYEYEQNTTATSVQQAAPDPDHIISTAQVIQEWLTGSQIFTDSILIFRINEAPNGATNNYNGGVIANISINPMAPVSQPPIMTNVWGYPYYTITKVREADSSPVSGPLAAFHQNLQTHGLTGVHMPNGWYEMRFYQNGYNQTNPPVSNPDDEGSPSERNASFTISYNRLDTTSVINYSLAGVRVKSIITRDPYANVTNKRTFRYHDPVNDSSYGAFIGSSVNTFIESSQFGQWQVRMGSFNMPGMGNVASSVFYPKVIEEVTDNGVTYRTEHYYSRGLGIYPSYSGMGWPFYPVDDIECARGNEYMTIWNKQASSAFTPAKIKQQVFDFDPPTVANPNVHFRRQLFGIKCAASSYDVNTVVTNGFAPSFVSLYPVTTTRLYMTSDSTKTFDLNNVYNGVSEWHDYVYGDKSVQPIINRTGNNSDGSVTVQKNWYAADQPEASSEINATVAAQMVTTNRINQPLGTKMYKDNQLLSQQFTYSHFAGSKLLTDSMRQAIFSNPLETEIKVLAYDDAANPLSILLRGNKYRRYIWNKQQGLALATCVMPQDGAFLFTSFEHAEFPTGTTNAAHFSGSYAYQLTSGNTIALNGFNSSTGLEVYAWTAGGGFTANSAPAVNTGITSGAWTLYKASLGAVTAVNISGNAMIDQLAVLPTGSSFEGNIYDGANRIVSKVTNDMQTTFFEYDNFGRLTIVRDMKGNIIKSSSYQYQAAQ